MLLNSNHLLVGRQSRRMRMFCFYAASDVVELIELIAAQTRTTKGFVVRGWLEAFEAQCDLPGHEPAATEYFHAIAKELPRVSREAFSVRLKASTVQALNRWADRFGCSASVFLNCLLIEAIRQWVVVCGSSELTKKLEQTPLAKAA